MRGVALVLVYLCRGRLRGPDRPPVPGEGDDEDRVRSTARGRNDDARWTDRPDRLLRHRRLRRPRGDRGRRSSSRPMRSTCARRNCAALRTSSTAPCYYRPAPDDASNVMANATDAVVLQTAPPGSGRGACIRKGAEPRFARWKARAHASHSVELGFILPAHISAEGRGRGFDLGAGNTPADPAAGHEDGESAGVHATRRSRPASPPYLRDL